MKQERYNHMEYQEGMEHINSDIMDRVLEAVSRYDYSKYTVSDVMAALASDYPSESDFAAFLSPAAASCLELMAQKSKAETAKHFGINSDRSVNYHADGQGTAVVFDAVSKTVCNFRKSRPLSSSWSDEIDKDYENRK